MDNLIFLAIGMIGLIVWIWQWRHPPMETPETVPPPRKYPLPPRPKNDDPGRWYG